MFDTKTIFPEFVANQVLTESQLNQLRNYLCAQNRLTRVRLVGTGIMCGFKWRRDAAAFVLDPGFGVSSDGFLIEKCAATTYKRYRSCTLLDGQDEGSSCSGQNGSSLEPPYPDWQTVASRPGQTDIVELVDETQFGTFTPAQKVQVEDLGAGDFATHVVVLYLEREPIPLTSCLVTNCDNKGLNINLNVRTLLVSRNILTSFPEPDTGPGQVLRTRLARVMRLHQQGMLAKLTSADAFEQAYGRIVTDTFDRLADKIRWAFGKFALLLDVAPLEDDLLLRLRDRLLAEPMDQYHYDAVKDLATAHNEFLAAACPLLGECFSSLVFPRHLMLGALDRTVGYRHRFVPSPVGAIDEGEIERIRKLLLRVRTMLAALYFTDPSQVSIVPSHTEDHALGSRAVPFYFLAGELAKLNLAELKLEGRELEELTLAESKLEDLWQPKLPCTTAPLWSSIAQPVEDRPAAEVEDYNRCSLLRIEGHLRRPELDARARILAARLAANAEFDVLLTRLESETDEVEPSRQALEEIRLKRKSEIEALDEMIAEITTVSELADAREKAKDLVASLGRIDERLVEVTKGRAETRRGRRLHCNTSSAETAYAAEREALLCLLQDARARIAQIRKLGASGDDDRLAVVRAGVARILPRLVLTAAAGASTGEEAGELLDSWLESWLKRQREDPLPPAIQLAWRTFDRAVAALLDALPAALIDFDCDLFTDRCKNVHDAALELWLLYVLFSAVIRGSLVAGYEGMVLSGYASSVYSEIHKGPPPLTVTAAEEEDFRSALLALMRCCVRPKIAGISRTYDAMRKWDVSSFENLVQMTHGGLEHLAGVAKGGTFVLVSVRDKDDTEKVIADFSLAGRVPCCCTVGNPDVNVVARPDYRVVIVRGKNGEYEPTGQVHLDVLRNDYDPDHRKLSVACGKTSALGATINAGEGKEIVYSLERPIAGAIDRFSYSVTAEDDGTDTARVFVLFLPDLATGRITGWVSAGGKRVEGAVVRIDGTDDQATTVDDGTYELDGVSPGDYILKAAYDDYPGGSATVTVKAGEIVEQNFGLVAATVKAGSILVTVVGAVASAAAGGKPKPVGGATVVLSRSTAGKPVEIDRKSSGEDGRVEFAELQPETYLVGASKSGYLYAEASLPVESARQSKKTLTLKKGYSIPHGFRDYVVAKKGPDVWERVQKEYEQRYDQRRTGVEKAAKDPKIVESYRASAAYLEDRVASPDYTDELLVEAYAHVARPLAQNAREATGKQKTALQGLLATITLATMDRLSLTNPDSFGDAARSTLAEAGKDLTAAGLAPAAAIEQWKGSGLKDSFAIESAATVGQILR